MTQRFIHIHIPRTGGTTFKYILDQVYGRENIGNLMPPEEYWASPMGVFIRCKDDPYYVDSANWIDAWDKEREERRGEEEQFQAYHGHVPLACYPEWLLDGAFVTTWLRNPIRLVFSWFFWDWSRPELCDFENIHEFIEQSSRQNIQTKMIGDGSRCDFVGITEHFGKDVAWLAKLFGWKYRHGYKNGQPQEYNEIVRKLIGDRGLVDKILRFNKDDVALYLEYSARRGLL